MDNSAQINSFQKQGFIKVPGVLPKPTCDLLTRYTTLKANNHPNYKKGQDPIDGAHREYGDQMMDSLMEYLRPDIERITGLQLWPTLSFYYHYVHGNELHKHRDRESLEVSVSLCLGHDDPAQRWPIYFENPEDPEHPIAIDLEIGDMVIFKGSTVNHWREKFSGQWHAQVVMGYVQQAGKFAHQKYDQRAGLGLPHIGMFAWTWGNFVAMCKRSLGRSA